MATVHLRFYAELGDLVAAERRGREFSHVCPARNSVKDLIEGLGVPHTEVDLVLVNGRSVGLAYQVADGDRLSLYPVFEAFDISAVTAVRAEPLRVTSFAADAHLGKLAGYLRLAGFDTLYRSDWDDAALAQVSASEHRILLSRDRGLMMRSVVTHGYLVRSTVPRRQLVEVLQRFDLWGSTRPFSRCSVCNSLVAQVSKADVVAVLSPRTAAHYKEFWRCPGCGRVYWQGAHYRSLRGLFDQPPAGEEGYAYHSQDPHGADA